MEGLGYGVWQGRMEYTLGSVVRSMATGHLAAKTVQDLSMCSPGSALHGDTRSEIGSSVGYLVCGHECVSAGIPSP